jgi:broad specificity phosphatase PhoE
MIVYLIRHGQTYGNRDGINQGWGDIGLTERGIEQAKELRAFFTEKKPDRVICSDIYRTRQTCSIIFEGRDDIEYDARLREINSSVFMGKTREEIIKLFGEEYIENSRRLNYAPYGGEGVESLVSRVASFLSDLEKDTKSKTVAVVTHGGTIFAFLHRILKMPIYTPPLRIGNCSVTRLGFDDGAWAVHYINYRIK